MLSKYQMILKDIKEDILSGHYQKGDKLPSIRQLSQLYHCSKDTVIKALQELRYQHYLYAMEKSGYYVLESRVDQNEEEEKSSLDPEAFAELPYQDFHTCVNESLIEHENYLFNYYHHQAGLEELIQSLYSLLMEYDVYCKKDQIAITSGSQQALYILSQMTFPEGKEEILIESPTYPRMQQLLDQQQLPYRTIERTLEGINLTELEEHFASGKIKFFYCIPRLHNPLGTTLDKETRQAIVDLAQRYQVYIVEDDHLADFDPHHTPPLHYLDQKEQVLYIKSFTPTLFPALRIGALVLPERLVHDFLAYKSLMDYDTNLIMQKALSLYIENGMFKKNTRKLATRYQMNLQQVQTRLGAISSPLPIQATDKGILIQLPQKELKAAIKHDPAVQAIISGGSHVYLLTDQPHDLLSKIGSTHH